MKAPVIRATEFASRRALLMQQMEADSIAIIANGEPRSRNRDVEYPWRSNSDFHYLTGFPEPNSILVLRPGREHGEFILFCPDKDPEREMWDGRRAGPEGAIRDFKADDAFPIGDIDDILPGLIEGCTRIYYNLGHDQAFDERLMQWVNVIRKNIRNGAHPPGEFVSLEHLLHEMRLIKSAGEIRMMQHAANISAEAHCQAMIACRPGQYEYQLEAELLHTFVRNGARHQAYPAIIGAGENGCILHYIENSARMRRNDLVLIDAGCEYGCYASDITRTFPVGGKFSRTQRALYDLVLEAQLAAIEQVQPGNHWDEPHQAAVQVLVDGLIRLGLLKGNRRSILKRETFRNFYMHRTGHWLGLDVHDVGDYRVGEQWRVLEPGMVLTIEPGLYISPGQRRVASKWQGIGIRIEDDVVVTEDGHKVLSDRAPKSANDIENLMAG